MEKEELFRSMNYVGYLRLMKAANDFCKNISYAQGVEVEKSNPDVYTFTYHATLVSGSTEADLEVRLIHDRSAREIRTILRSENSDCLERVAKALMSSASNKMYIAPEGGWRSVRETGGD